MPDKLSERLRRQAEILDRIQFFESPVDAEEAAVDAAKYREIADALDAKDARIAELERERDEARGIVRDIFWMALRYADGRKSYAVGMVNDAITKAYEAGWITPKDEGGDLITPRFARDGMSPEWESLESRLASHSQLLEEARASIWHAMSETPETRAGTARYFIIAIRRARQAKVFSFPAQYLNAYPLQYNDGCTGVRGTGCPEDGSHEDGCPTTGWFYESGDGDYDSNYTHIHLDPGDEMLAWTDVPQFSSKLESR